MNNNNHGGARKGAGRKKGQQAKPRAKKDITLKQHSVGFSEEQWKQFLKEGGGKTLRKMLDNGTFKKCNK